MNKIVLTKPQIVSKDIKVLVWDDGGEDTALARYLCAITKTNFRVWLDGETGKYWGYNVEHTTLYDNAKYLPTTKEVLMNREEVMEFIMNESRVRNIVIRFHQARWEFPFNICDNIRAYEYTYLKNGTHSEPKKFMKTVEVDNVL